MAASVEQKQIFVEEVAADLVSLGLAPAADEFQIFLRYVPVPNTVEADAWRARLPLTVLRVRYNDASDPSRPVPYPIPDYEIKTADSELGLADDLQDLIDTVSASVACSGRRTASATTRTIRSGSVRTYSASGYW